METTTIIILIGIALAAFNALVVIACVVKSARINQRVVEDDSLKPAWTVSYRHTIWKTGTTPRSLRRKLGHPEHPIRSQRLATRPLLE